jgi:kynurenine formamidase
VKIFDITLPIHPKMLHRTHVDAPARFNADLDAVPAGRYELVRLPAKLIRADGPFARPILISRD